MDHIAIPTQGNPQKQKLSTLEDQAITDNSSDLPTHVNTRWLQNQISRLKKNDNNKK